MDGRRGNYLIKKKMIGQYHQQGKVPVKPIRYSIDRFPQQPTFQESPRHSIRFAPHRRELALLHFTF